MDQASSHSITDPASEALKERVLRQAGELISLALPIMASRAGWMMMGIVDTIMVGRFATNELAYQSVGGSIFGMLFVPAMGLMLGTLVVTSNAMGERNFGECGAAWRRSLPYGAAVGLALGTLCQFAEPLLHFLGQSEGLASGAAEIIAIHGYGAIFGVAMIGCMFFLEGIKRPVPAMVMMGVANLANAGLNWVLIYGHLGMPAMGAAGSAWATTIIRALLLLALVVFIWNMRAHDVFKVRVKPAGGWAGGTKARKIGYASGASFGIEHLAFAALTSVFAARMGETSVAAFSVVFTIFAFYYMAAAGMGNATAVLVGSAYGAKDRSGVAVAGWLGLGVTTLILILPAGSMIAFPEALTRVFSRDPAVILLAVPICVLGGLALLFDAAQTLMANALRGRHEAWWATGSHFFSYILLMLPLSWYLAFPAGRAGPGLMEAVIIASVVSSSVLICRFAVLAHRDARLT